jgi:hypothetical protein
MIAIRIRSLAPWNPNKGRVAATVKAAAEAFKKLRLLSIQRVLPYFSAGCARLWRLVESHGLAYRYVYNTRLARLYTESARP